MEYIATLCGPDTHISRLDVTFDQFNIRHNEPMSQLGRAIKSRYVKYSRALGVKWAG
jgi:hypothetical protein